MTAIAKQRLKSGLTQEYVAYKLGIDRSTVAKWETGVSLPRPAMLMRIAGLYNCKIDDLLREEESA